METSILLDYIITFILLLYGDPNLPRNIVDKILRFVCDFNRNFLLQSLQNDIINIIKKSETESEMISKIKDSINLHGNIFDTFLTESDRFNHLKKKGFCMPEEYEIRTTWTEKIVNNKLIFVQQPVFAVQLSLKHTLKIFLQIPGLFNQILDYVNKLSQESTIISNIMQGKFWLNKIRASSQHIFPLYIYYDEIETGNPLGSHAGVNKFGMVYASIACLPPKIASRLNRILFSTIIRVEDKKKTSNKNAFQKLIEQLVSLEKEGITVNINNSLVTVRFQLVLILGDNLGLNSICGFVESFKAQVYCRICKASANECKTLTTENQAKLRNKQNYIEDLSLKNVQLTGLKEECVLIKAVLYNLIFVKKFFTLETLNERITNFTYISDDSNKPPVIKKNRFKDKLNLKFSASEMQCLVRYLGVMIGDLVPEGDEFWDMYIILRKIVYILLSPRLEVSCIRKLKLLIQKLNQLYIENCGPLKPKFHFLTHYVTILEYFGPCVHFQSMRYESQHREIKSIFQATSSNKNPLKTIAIKQILKMCQVVDSMMFEYEILFHSKDQRYQNCYKSVTIDGTTYRIGSFVVVSLKNVDIEFGEIIKIEKVIISEEVGEKGMIKNPKLHETIKLTINIFEEVIYDNHISAYIVKRNCKNDKNILFKNLPILPPVTPVKLKGEQYIVTRFAL